MNPDLYGTSFSQVNRRFRVIDILPYDIPESGSITIAIDSTGVKVYGNAVNMVGVSGGPVPI